VALGGVLLVISRTGSNGILIATLGVIALVFGASALILARPGR